MALYKGMHVNPSKTDGVEWIKKAAAQGDKKAEAVLAKLSKM
jgi:TPR repeat protein